jgi:glycosyltransferase involved in cell wall biosynthesis
VLRQDYKNYELIIINDGSTDLTQTIINEYAKRDDRIIPIKQKNAGLVATLNKGIGLARGIYIARIDGDDPWMEGKLTDQISELEKDERLVLIGGGFEIIDENGYYIETIFPPTRDEDIRRTLMLRNTFGHAGVIYRKDAIVKAGLYSNQCGPTEDYDMWIKLSSIGRLKNLAHPVYRYRIHRNGISQQNSQKQALATKQHVEKIWSKSTPRVLSRREIIIQSNRYLHQTPQLWYGQALKEQFLSDNAQIGVKLIRHGHIINGLLQILYVASIGRSGTKAALKRIRSINIMGHILNK